MRSPRRRKATRNASTIEVDFKKGGPSPRGGLARCRPADAQPLHPGGAYDRVPSRRARVAGDRPLRYAEGIPGSGAAGAREAQSRFRTAVICSSFRGRKGGLERITQDEAAAEIATPPRNQQNASSGREKRRKPARRLLPDHLPRERIVHPAPSACSCCGGPLRKLGEDITCQRSGRSHVREKFSCRKCEAITQPPAPSYPIARGRASDRHSAMWHNAGRCCCDWDTVSEKSGTSALCGQCRSAKPSSCYGIDTSLTQRRYRPQVQAFTVSRLSSTAARSVLPRPPSVLSSIAH